VRSVRRSVTKQNNAWLASLFLSGVGSTASVHLSLSGGKWGTLRPPEPVSLKGVWINGRPATNKYTDSLIPQHPPNKQHTPTNFALVNPPPALATIAMTTIAAMTTMTIAAIVRQTTPIAPTALPRMVTLSSAKEDATVGLPSSSSSSSCVELTRGGSWKGSGRDLQTETMESTPISGRMACWSTFFCLLRAQRGSNGSPHKCCRRVSRYSRHGRP